jgi:hypothetical protein
MGEHFSTLARQGSAAFPRLGGGGVAGSGVRLHYCGMRLRDVENRLLVLAGELSTLRETIRALESESRLLQTEWAETHRKILNTLRSLSRAGGKKAPAEDEETPAAGVPPGSGLDEISARIHARRNRPHGLPDSNAEAIG